MLILIASYIFIAILLIALEALPIPILKQKKRFLMAFLAALDIILMVFVWLVQKQQDIRLFIFLPVIVLGSSIYELYREKKGGDKVYYFSIPAHSYEIKKQLGVNWVIGPMLKSSTAIFWDGKRIIMPQTFSSEGEALELACYRMKDGSEGYYCKSVTTVEAKRPIGKTLVSLSLLVSVLAMPLCFYLSKSGSTNPEYWVGLGEGFMACLVFGFAKQVMAGPGGSVPLRLMRIVMTGFYILCLLGVVMKVAGI